MLQETSKIADCESNVSKTDQLLSGSVRHQPRAAAGKGGFVFTALLKFPLQLHQMLQFQRILVLIRRNKLDWLEILSALPHFLRYTEGRRTASVFALPLLLEGCRGPPTRGGPLLLHGGEREDPALPPGFCWGELEPSLSLEV